MFLESHVCEEFDDGDEDVLGVILFELCRGLIVFGVDGLFLWLMLGNMLVSLSLLLLIHMDDQLGF